MKRIVWMLLLAAAIVTLATFWSTCQAQVVFPGVVKPAAAGTDSIVFDAVGGNYLTYADGNTRWGWAHTVGNHSDDIILVRFRSWSDGTPATVDSMKLKTANQSFSMRKDTVLDVYTREALWYLMNPATGADSIIVWSNISGGNLTGVSASYYGVNQSSPSDSCYVEKDPSGTTGSITVSSDATDRVVATVGYWYGVSTWTGNMIERGAQETASDSYPDASIADRINATTVTIESTSAEEWIWIVLVLNKAP